MYHGPSRVRPKGAPNPRFRSRWTALRVELDFTDARLTRLWGLVRVDPDGGAPGPFQGLDGVLVEAVPERLSPCRKVEAVCRQCWDAAWKDRHEGA